MNIINLTPHAVNVVDHDGNPLVDFPASGTVARVSVSTTEAAPLVVNGISIPTCTRTNGAIVGLPDPAPDTMYIVSSVVRAACPDRTDLLVPDNFVRRPDGTIIGCQGFGR